LRAAGAFEKGGEKIKSGVIINIDLGSNDKSVVIDGSVVSEED
jgi:hypothetical protein